MENKTYIDNPFKLQISNKIAEAKIRETLYVNTTFESAVIAAFQVQSILIESNSIQPPPPKSPKKDILSIFIDIVIDMAIQAVAGKIIKSGLKRIMEPVLISREAYLFRLVVKENKQNFNYPEIQLDKNQIDKMISKVDKEMSDNEFKSGSIGYKLFHDIPKKLATKAIDKDVKKIKSFWGLKKVNKNLIVKKKYNFSPITQILLQAQKQKYRQSASIEFMYNGLEAELNYSQIEVDVANSWIKLFDENISLYQEDDIGALGQELTLWFEFSIWAFTYKPDEVIKKKKKKETPKRLTGMSSKKNNRLLDAYNDMRNYSIHTSENEKSVIYSAPDDYFKYGSRGIGIFKNTIEIPKYILDYMVNHFISKHNNPQQKTIYEKKDELFRTEKSMKNQHTNHENFYTHREHRILIAAYEELFNEFRLWWRKVGNSKKRVTSKK